MRPLAIRLCFTLMGIIVPSTGLPETFVSRRMYSLRLPRWMRSWECNRQHSAAVVMVDGRWSMKAHAHSYQLACPQAASGESGEVWDPPFARGRALSRGFGLE